MDTHVRRRLVVGGALAAALGGAAGCSSDSGDASVHTTPNAGADTGRSPSSSPTPKPPTHAELIVAENAKPGDPLWRIPEDQVAAESALTGYTSVASAVPGDRVGLHVRAAAPFTVTAYRIGYYAGVGGRQVWASAEFPATQQPQPRLDEGRMVVAGWSKTLELDTTGWPEGSYLLALRSQGKGRYVPLTMRATDTKDRVVVVNPTTTWQAYNTFGGFSLYVGANGQPKSVRVSFDRPYENNALHFILDELPYVQLAEQHGIPVAYLNSEDLERPGILAGALGVVSGGHDEYWSVPMREAVTVARDAGTNVAFLGGNEIYWRVRFESDNRVVVGYKQSAGADPVKNDPTTTGLWRQAPHPNPEVSLTGQMYECYPVSGPWVVHTPDFFLYEGTGVTKGRPSPISSGSSPTGPIRSPVHPPISRSSPTARSPAAKAGPSMTRPTTRLPRAPGSSPSARSTGPTSSAAMRATRRARPSHAPSRSTCSRRWLPVRWGRPIPRCPTSQSLAPARPPPTAPVGMPFSSPPHDGKHQGRVCRPRP